MHRSTRLPGALAPNALSRALADLRAAGTPFLDLTVSNPTAAGFAYPEAELRALLGAAEVLRYTPEAHGHVTAREAVAATHGHGVTPEQVLLAASTSELYTWLFKALGDPGDEVLTPVPSYPLFEWLARLEGLTARAVPAWFHERWHLDLEALDAACTPRTRAILVVNPNNPTGQHLTRTEWTGLTALCARRDLVLVVDEVFADFTLERRSDELPTALEDLDPPCPVVVLSGLSKVALLPQVKLGWAVLRGPGTAALLEDLAFIADQLLSVSASAQAAAPGLLALAPALRAQVSARLRANLATLDAALAGHPALDRLPVGGGWSVLLRRPAVDADDACALRLLREARTLVHPGHFFDLPGDGHLVLSLLTPEATFACGLEGILPRLQEPAP